VAAAHSDITSVSDKALADCAGWLAGNGWVCKVAASAVSINSIFKIQNILRRREQFAPISIPTWRR
jgi:hypothetical protein